MQVWPLFRNFDATATRNDRSISASSKTIKGAFPPNSKDIFFTELAAFCINNLPMAVEPVNDSLRIKGLSVKRLPINSESPVTILNTPAGIPASSASTANANAEKGVKTEGLSIIVQPAAKAGAHFRVIIALGKFQGVIAPTTPTDCLLTNKC